MLNVKEFEVSPGCAAIGELSAAVDSVKTGDDIVVFRNGLKLFDEPGWIEFMKASCNLQHDRHFDFSSVIELADWWEISNQPDKESSYAYSTTPQPFHTDNGWFSKPPEINFFIMKKQAIRGGEQIVYPARSLVADLRTEDPELLTELCETRVTIQKGDAGECNNTTIICGADSDSPTVFWNYYRTIRSSDHVSDMCERFFQYLAAKQNTPSVYTLSMNSGDCFFFNDTRTLHGRKSFTATAPRDRILLQSMWKIPPA